MFFQRILARPRDTLTDDEITEIRTRLWVGADPNAIDGRGCTPLEVAFRVGMDDESIRALARVTDFARASTATLTRVVVERGRLPLLLEVGGTLVRDDDLTLPLEHLALRGDAGAQATLRALFATPFGRGASAGVNARDHKGRTVLHALLKRAPRTKKETGREDALLRMLLCAGADPFAHDAKGRTPFAKAANPQHALLLIARTLRGRRPSKTGARAPKAGA